MKKMRTPVLALVAVLGVSIAERAMACEVSLQYFKDQAICKANYEQIRGLVHQQNNQHGTLNIRNMRVAPEISACKRAVVCVSGCYYINVQIFTALQTGAGNVACDNLAKAVKDGGYYDKVIAVTTGESGGAEAAGGN